MDCVESDTLGVDAADDASLLFLLFEREDAAVILRVICVLPRDFIQMMNRSFVDEFRFPADLNEAGGILRVDDEERDFGVATHVPPLLAFQ